MIYVRDRKPSVRFTSKAYVLPRTGQRGIPCHQRQYRARSRRGLSHRRPQPHRHRHSASDFQRSLDRYDIDQLADSAARGVERRTQRGTAAQCRCHHRLPDRQGGRRPQARRLRHDGAARGGAQPTNTTPLATQWFIVSDLGLTAFPRNDGVHVFVHSLAQRQAAAAGRASG